MQPYLDLMRRVLAQGVTKADRTGTGTWSLFGEQLRFDLRAGFPAVTTKKLFFKGVAVELLWFLRGDTDLSFLHAHGVTIWDEWADAAGRLGPVYGAQWRAWPTPDGRTVDQLTGLVAELRANPDSRRHIISAWNVGVLSQMRLPPCHLLFQFYVAEGRLSCQVYQRSADIFLGLPFNIASYALLTHLVAQVTGLEVGDLVFALGDVHLYHNHLAAAQTQLARLPLALPRLALNPEVRDLYQFTWADIQLENYQHHLAITAPVAV